MGRLRKIAAAAMVCFMTAVMGTAVYAEEDQRDRIEQVIIDMPQVYVYGEGFTAEDAAAGQAFVSEKKLALDAGRSGDASGDGISYYILLDKSASIPSRYFDPVKDSIEALQYQLTDKDSLKLCAFGTTVDVAADGSQTADEMVQILADIKNKDQETLLFDAIDRMADLAAKERQDKSDRIVLVVITDGEDFATGKTQSQEALNTLAERGLPAYAFCIKDTAKENINSFGEFSRTSGGKMRIFEPAEAAELLPELHSELKGLTKLSYTADSNRVSNKKETFSLKFADESVISRDVMENHWIPDTESPFLQSVEAVNGTQIRLQFSEPVEGADNASNYKLNDAEKEFPISNVAYDDDTKQAVSLFLSDSIFSGSYSLSYSNITDISMEKNPLLVSDKSSGLTVGTEGSDGTRTVLFDISNLEEQKKLEKKAEKRNNSLIGILFLVFAALIGVIIAIVATRGKKNKEEQETPAEPTPAPVTAAAPMGTVAMAGNDFKQHVAINRDVKKLNVWIESRGMQPVSTIWELGTSLIVGRDQMCDIKIDDRNMSRQHFCLERNGSAIYIQDLQSTNGTNVNGIRIGDRRLLNSGDVIEVGSVRLTIRW